MLSLPELDVSSPPELEPELVAVEVDPSEDDASPALVVVGSVAAVASVELEPVDDAAVGSELVASGDPPPQPEPTSTTMAKPHERRNRGTEVCVVGWRLGPGADAPVLLPSLQIDRGPQLLEGLDPRMLAPRRRKGTGTARAIDYLPAPIDRPRVFEGDADVLIGRSRARNEPCLRRAPFRRDVAELVVGHWAHRRGHANVGNAPAELSDFELMMLRDVLSDALIEQARQDHQGFAPAAQVKGALERIIALDAGEYEVRMARAWLEGLPLGGDTGAPSHLGFLASHLHDQAMPIHGEYNLHARPEHHHPPQWWEELRIRDVGEELIGLGLVAVPPTIDRLDDTTVSRVRSSTDPSGYMRVSELARQVLGKIARRPLGDAAAARTWWRDRCAHDPFAAALQRAHEERSTAAALAVLRMAITPAPLR